MNEELTRDELREKLWNNIEMYQERATGREPKAYMIKYTRSIYDIRKLEIICDKWQKLAAIKEMEGK